MPWIIDYPTVLDTMHHDGFRCLYYNSGAFGFPTNAKPRTVAWIGRDDPAIHESARPFTRVITPPETSALAGLATAIWQEHLPGRVWAMPTSHWAFEMDAGNREWMSALIEHMDLDPGLLANRKNGSAIEFALNEPELFQHFLSRLLEMLSSTDFMLAWPGRPVLCTVHSHRQLQWMGTDETLMQHLNHAGLTAGLSR